MLRCAIGSLSPVIPVSLVWNTTLNWHWLCGITQTWPSAFLSPQAELIIITTIIQSLTKIKPICTHKLNYPVGTHQQLCQSPNITVNEQKYRFNWSHWKTALCSGFLLQEGFFSPSKFSFFFISCFSAWLLPVKIEVCLLWTMSSCWAV